MLGRKLLSVSLISVLVLAFAATGPSQAAAQQRGLMPGLTTTDLIALRQACGAAEPRETSLQSVRQHALGQGRSRTGDILAFEENKLFIYALADMSQGTQDNGQWIRRLFLLKPSTLVVEDLISASPGAERPMRWLLRTNEEPTLEAARIRVGENDVEILGHCLLPMDASLKKRSRARPDGQVTGYRVTVTPAQPARESRSLMVFHVGTAQGQQARLSPTLAQDDMQLELAVAVQERTFQMTLPVEGARAGTIKVSAADGKTLLPNRLLPSGIMPHGPEGARLLERWDAPYRDGLPGWDVGRPSTHLVQAVEDGTFPPGRAIVLGCGTGSNALYLAGKGFEVTGVDVAPTALSLAADKARQAGVKAEWVLADVVALPKLETFDLIFDRGCYHHICQYNSAGYVETLRRLSHPGTQALILAGSPADGGRGGPPRIPEQTIRRDFSPLFEFPWLRNIHFETRNPDAQGPSAWSIHLRRKGE